MAQVIWSRLTRKQVNVVYANAKKGNIRVEKWMISQMYELADETEQIIDWNGSIGSKLDKCRMILDAIFANDYEKAQRIIDWAFDINLYGRKTVERIDRTVIA